MPPVSEGLTVYLQGLLLLRIGLQTAGLEVTVAAENAAGCVAWSTAA